MAAWIARCSRSASANRWGVRSSTGWKRWMLSLTTADRAIRRALPLAWKISWWKATWAPNHWLASFPARLRAMRSSGFWSRAKLAGAARCAARRAARPSSTSRRSYSSAASSSARTATRTPPPGSNSTRPSCWSRPNASRTGVRLMASWSARSVCRSRAPAVKRPSRMASRSVWVASSTRRRRRSGATGGLGMWPGFCIQNPGRVKSPYARVVRRQVAHRVIGQRLHQLLDRLEARIARTPLVLAEQHHLVLQIAGRLTGEIGNELGAIATAIRSVADDAWLGRRAAAARGGGVDRDLGRLALEAAEVRGVIVDAELDHLLGVRLHLRRRPLAGRVVGDCLLEVLRPQPGQDRHGVAGALAGEAVAGRAVERFHGAGGVERAGAGDGRRSQDESDTDHDLHGRLLLSDHVVPDGPCPPERVLSYRGALAGRQLLLDLHDLAVLDPVRVDHRDRLAVVDPRVARVAGGELGRLLAVELVDDRHRRHLAHGVGDVPRLRYGQADRRVAHDVDVRRLGRLERQVIDLAPALVGADEIRLHGDGARSLGRDQVHDVVLHFVAEVRRDLARAGVDLHQLVRRAVVNVRILAPGGAEECRLRDDVLVRVEDDELGPRLALLEVPRHLAGALVRPGRAAIRGGRDAEDEHAAVGHGAHLLGQRLGLWPSLPGVQHLVLVLGEALDQLPLELDARSDDRAGVLDIALAHAHAARRGIQRARRLVDHPHATAAEARVVEGDTVERAYAAQHQVAEGTRDELAVGLEQDELDGRIAQPPGFFGGCAPPHPSADGRNTGAPSLPARPDALRPRRVNDAARAKPAIAIQSFSWPSRARQIDPAPHPPASVMPIPKRRPPTSAPAPALGNTHSDLSLRSVNLRIAKPSVQTINASAAARVCSALPLRNGSRNARTRQNRERWKIIPKATPKSRKIPCGA